MCATLAFVCLEPTIKANDWLEPVNITPLELNRYGLKRWLSR